MDELSAFPEPALELLALQHDRRVLEEDGTDE